jgi:putative component of membrane protein insertase Oxa1/YidC/SpoIIIJ protein YidD
MSGRLPCPALPPAALSLAPLLIATALLAAGLVAGGGCAGPRHPSGSPCASAPGFAPWDEARASAGPAPPGDVVHGGDAAGAGDGLIAIYQRYLRGPDVPGGGCPFHPSCSSFGRIAVQRYGVLGLVLIVDRLFIREHPLAASAYPVYCDGRRARFDDPVP